MDDGFVLLYLKHGAKAFNPNVDGGKVHCSRKLASAPLLLRGEQMMDANVIFQLNCEVTNEVDIIVLFTFSIISISIRAVCSAFSLVPLVLSLNIV